MKKTLILFFMIALVFAIACKKDLNACKDYEEIKRTSKHLVDINSTNAPELLDTLEKYPQLQLQRFDVYSWGWQATCNIFYKELPVFYDKYILSKSIHTTGLNADSTLLKPVTDISITPKISIEEAVKKARYYINLDHGCVQYELGCYTSYVWIANTSKRKYILAWKIRAKDYSSYAVILNAETNELLVQGYYDNY